VAAERENRKDDARLAHLRAVAKINYANEEIHKNWIAIWSGAGISVMLINLTWNPKRGE
jgi:hypothetical protein